MANNPDPLTYHGTNTYLVFQNDGILVIDPGPDLPEHVDAIVRHAGPRITGIVMTHGHGDHVGAAPALAAATGAPTYGYAPCVYPEFVPDFALSEGDRLAGMEVIHTPGHAPDHLCFARPDGILFTGDHVMGWSSTFIGAPAGNMTEYLASLRRLLARVDTMYLAAHGPALRDPQAYVTDLLLGRLKREGQILEFLQRQGPCPTDTVLDAIYPKAVAPRTRRAAERTLTAHLLKLEKDGMATQDQQLWRAIR